MDASIPYLGKGLALLTAVVWAFAVILFRKSGETVHPIALNLFKNSLAVILFIATIWLFGGTLMHPAPAHIYILLLLSGAIGIGIGDTLFFKCLNLLGAGLTAIVDCLYSPFIIGLSVVWLRESLTLVQILGALVIVSAIMIATGITGKERISRRNMVKGIIYGVLALAAMAVSIVTIKPLLEQSPLLWATEIRLCGGLVVLIPILILHPKKRTIVASLFSHHSWIYTLLGSFFGAYVAMFIWLAGMKYTQASIASALNQTSTIFIFIFAAIFLKETITLGRTIGIILAFFGTFLVLFG